MTRILIVAIAIVLSAGAQAAAPEFNMDHFCADFAQNHASPNMGDLAKAVCMLSEESTKAVVDKAWDRVSADNRESCLKTAMSSSGGPSYMSLAQCLKAVPQQ